MLFKKVKERLVEETERFYHATKNENLDVTVNVAPPRVEKKVTNKRQTKNTIKWHSKIN